MVTTTSVWEVRTTGADTNGGAFDPTVSGAGTDFSQQDAAQISVTDAVTTSGSSTITSATASFTSAHVGNAIRISGGTGSQAELHKIITVVNSATSITVNSSTGIVTGTGVTLALGGALRSFGYAGLHTQSSNIVFGKAGVYTITSTPAANNSGSNVLWVGYDTTRTTSNMDTNLPILRAGSGGIRLYNYSGSASIIRNFEFDGVRSLYSGVTGVHSGAFNRIVERCRFVDMTGIPCQGEFGNNPASVHLCFFRNCGVMEQGNVYRCVFTGYTGAAVFSYATECIAYGCTVTPFQLINRASNCVSFGNTGGSSSGFNLRDSGLAINCISYSNGGRGFDGSNGQMINCAEGANGAASNTRIARATVTLAASPFINAAGGDFRLIPGSPLADSGYEEWLGLVPLDIGARIGSYGAVASGGGPLVRPNFNGGFNL